MYTVIYSKYSKKFSTTCREQLIYDIWYSNKKHCLVTIHITNRRKQLAILNEKVQEIVTENNLPPIEINTDTISFNSNDYFSCFISMLLCLNRDVVISDTTGIMEQLITIRTVYDAIFYYNCFVKNDLDLILHPDTMYYSGPESFIKDILYKNLNKFYDAITYLENNLAEVGNDRTLYRIIENWIKVKDSPLYNKIING